MLRLSRSARGRDLPRRRAHLRQSDAQSVAEPLHEQHDDAPQDIRAIHESHIEENDRNEQIEEEEVWKRDFSIASRVRPSRSKSASTTANWNQEFRLATILKHSCTSFGWPGEATRRRRSRIALEHEEARSRRRDEMSVPPRVRTTSQIPSLRRSRHHGRRNHRRRRSRRGPLRSFLRRRLRGIRRRNPGRPRHISTAKPAKWSTKFITHR